MEAQGEPTTQKELCFQKDARKDDEVMGALFQFDIITLLANIPTCITLYELLQLSTSTREVLREALVDFESFLAQIAEPPDEVRNSYPHCHQVMRQILHIIFSPEDIQLKNIKHNRPLYYIGYVGSTQVSRIQINPGFALSVTLRRLMQLLGISLHHLTPINTIIFGFNANDSSSLGKIKL